MRILRDVGAIAALPDVALRQLIERRIQEIESFSAWDSDEMGPFVVVEPGDAVDTLEAELGLPVLRGLFDDVPFGDADFSPSFEWAEAHPEGVFELLYVTSDSGYGHDVFIYDLPGVDPALLAMCRTYASG